MELHRILVPYDFSQSAGHAARYACGLAGRFGGEVTILHVLQPPPQYDFSMTEPSEDLRREVNRRRAARALQELSTVLPDLPAGKVHREVAEGDAAEVIVTAANEQRYDALVMSTRGAGAFQRLLMIGSVTSKVLHGCERPVITSVRFENHEPPVEIGSVIAAVDLGPQTTNVLCWGMRTASKFGARLEVAHVSAPEPALESEDGEAWRERSRERAVARIGEIKRHLNVQAETTVEFGHPARALSELAQRRGADLLVLGRGVSQDMLGRLRANAYDIIRQCPCPVVSI